MKTIPLFLMALCALNLSAQYNYKNLEAKTELSNEQLKTYTYENLRIYPINARESFLSANKNIGRYTPLNEALQKQKVKITETSAGSDSRQASPTVNTLYIQNLSGDTVYLMGGEVVKGGNQDRVIAQDMILPPKGKKINLDVYCVEHGRWTYNSPTDSNTFNSTYSVTSTSVRKAAQVENDQSKVWDKVEEVTTKNNSQTQTGTYTALSKSKDYSDKLNKYVSFFKTQLSKENNVIGFVAVSGDKVIGCDMFATGAMFKQQEDNLLRSYSTEVITNGSAVKLSNGQVKAYLDKLLLNEAARPETLEKQGKEFKEGDKTMHIAVY